MFRTFKIRELHLNAYLCHDLRLGMSRVFGSLVGFGKCSNYFKVFRQILVTNGAQKSTQMSSSFISIMLKVKYTKMYSKVILSSFVSISYIVNEKFKGSEIQWKHAKSQITSKISGVNYKCSKTEHSNVKLIRQKGKVLLVVFLGEWVGRFWKSSKTDRPTLGPLGLRV